LHDNVNVGDNIKLFAPCGEFTLQESTRPLLLVTGGVGLTPAISMLEHCVAQQSQRPIHFIHAARSSDQQAFKARVETLAQRHDNIDYCFLYNEPNAEDQAAIDDDKLQQGFVTQELLASKMPADCNVDLYFLGPKPFMSALWQHSKDLGIPENQVHFEFFGPLQELEAPSQDEAA